MSSLNLDSGDCNNVPSTNVSTDEEKIKRENKDVTAAYHTLETSESIRTEQDSARSSQLDEITSEIVENNEAKLKERVAQCKSIIASLKLQLNEEKGKLAKQANAAQRLADGQNRWCSKNKKYDSNSVNFSTNLSSSTNLLNTNMDNNVNCDENLVEYEKQLQRYQNTLNMAQIEKKNAIRKQMLAKAYKLKLLEVENQCNIELLRVKQSLQCLEPLQMIVEKWKDTSEDTTYDVNNFELIPRYPELYGNSANDVNLLSSELKVKEQVAISSANSNDPTNLE